VFTSKLLSGVLLLVKKLKRKKESFIEEKWKINQFYVIQYQYTI